VRKKGIGTDTKVGADHYKVLLFYRLYGWHMGKLK